MAHVTVLSLIQCEGFGCFDLTIVPRVVYVSHILIPVFYAAAPYHVHIIFTRCIKYMLPRVALKIYMYSVLKFDHLKIYVKKYGLARSI